MNKHSSHRHIRLPKNILPTGGSGFYIDILDSIRECFSLLSVDYELDALFIARFSIEIPMFVKGERISSLVLNKEGPQEYREPDEPDLSSEPPGLLESKSKVFEQLIEVIRSRKIADITSPHQWKALINNPEYNNAFEFLVESFVLRLRDDDFFPRFIWTREVPECENSPYPIRYDLLLFTDGALPQSACKHISTLASILSKMTWEDEVRCYIHSIPILLGDKLHFNGVVVHPQSRTYSDEIAQVFHSVSDIALCKKPFKLPIGCLEFGRSDFPGWKPTLRALI